MERQGHILGETLLYETLKVPYVDGKKRRTYIVDFFCPETKVAYELTWSTHRSRRKKVKKADAALRQLEAMGISYQVVDELSVGRITTIEAHSIPEVELAPRAMRTLARSRIRRRRRVARRR